MVSPILITLIVGYIFSLIEAIIQYNIGYKSSNPNDNKFIVFPNYFDLIKILITLAISAIFAGIISKSLLNYFGS